MKGWLSMIEQTFSATRCRDTRKPREGECPGVCFYRCEVCGALFPVTRGLGMDAGNEAREIICCGKKLCGCFSCPRKKPAIPLR